MKALLTLSVILLLDLLSIAQADEIFTKTYITNEIVVTKKLTYQSNEKLFVNNIAVVKKNYKTTDGTVEISETHNSGDFPVIKEKEYSMSNMEGYAELSIDTKDPSILHINYYPELKQKICKDWRYTVFTRNLDDQGLTYSAGTPLTATQDIYVRGYLQTSDPSAIGAIPSTYDNTCLAYYEVSPSSNECECKGKTQKYYIVVTVGDSENYHIKLKKNEELAIKQSACQIGAVTIPFKARIGTNRQYENYTSDFNAGLYIGYSPFGRIKYEYDGSKTSVSQPFNVTFGLTFGASTEELDEKNTALSEKKLPSPQKSTIGVFSSSLTTMLAYKKLRIGLHLGVDSGIGSKRDYWDHNNQLWLGIGFGYNIYSGFWTEKE